MTRESIQAEIGQISLRLHALTRGGVARTKESETELARLQGRKAELEAAWATAPAAAAMNPHQRELTALESELGAVRHRVETLLSRPTPLTMSAEEAEAAQLRAHAERMEQLNARLATVRAAAAASAPAAPAPAAAAPPRRVTPADFPRAVSSSPPGAVAGHLLQQLDEGRAMEDVTTEAAVRDGRYGQHRADVHRRLGLPAPNDQRTRALVGVPSYGRLGGNGLQSPAVQAQLIARGKRLA